MIWILDPWLFYLLFSIVILGLAFLIGTGLHSLLKRKGAAGRKIERLSALGLALLMAAVYLFGTEIFTDRASEGERIITHNGIEEVSAAQQVIIPFGEYAVMERLYDFGYTKEDTIAGESVQATFTIADGRRFMQEYTEYIVGNGIFVNRGRIAFDEIYTKEWRPELENNRENAKIPAMRVQITTPSS